MKAWRDLSVTMKLYSAVGIMGILIGCELLTLRFSMHTLSAVRAFVGGEALWSKAQKDAVLSIQRFALKRDERDYQAFVQHLEIPDGDRRARLEMEKAEPDFARIQEGFVSGGIHPDDVGPMVDLITRFGRVSYIADAIRQWVEGDRLLVELKKLGQRIHERHDPDGLAGILELNARLTAVEGNFSGLLGEGSRWLERIVLLLLSLGVFAVEAVGLTLTISTGRAISRSLREIRDAAERISGGDFSRKLEVRSGDELGAAAAAVNKMSESLELAVSSRTRELRRLAEENKELYRRAQQNVVARDEFLSVASHELKTPLTALHLQLQLMERIGSKDPAELGGERGRETLRKASRQAMRLRNLVEELLDLTRLQHGKFELHRQEADLSALAAESVSDLGEEALKAGSHLTVHAPGPVVGRYDPVRMHQVFSNLISNAIKYGQGGPIVLSVSRADGEALIQVQDRGRGIPEELQQRIFERFERADDVKEISGLGLGLYVTRAVVEAHGGRIRVESRPGDGSRFIIQLPASGG